MRGSQDCHLLLPPPMQHPPPHPLVFPPHSSVAHDRRVIDSETDTICCFLAAYQQQSLSSSFRSLSGLMKDRRWNSMAVITTVAPSPLLPISYVTTQHSLFPTNSGITAPPSKQKMLIPNSAAVSYFVDFLLDFQKDLCGPGGSDVSAAICKYLWVCFTHTRNPCSLQCSCCQGMFHSVELKNVHLFQARLCLSLSGILIVSMNNIFQVSSHSSLGLLQRKLSNSRQVVQRCRSADRKVAPSAKKKAETKTLLKTATTS